MIGYGHISTASELAKEVSSATEASILAQLNDFISRGLIEVRTTQPVFVQGLDNNKIEVKTSVQLVLKDKEYILKLEKRNEELENIFDAMNKVKESK